MPNNPPLPTSSPNVASLANPSTLSNLSNSSNVQTFGDQVRDKAKQQVTKAAADSPLTRLYKEKADLIKEGITLDINHQKILFTLDQQNKVYNSAQSGSISNISKITTPSQLTVSLDSDDIKYVNDTSWKTQTPDKEHGLRQCNSNYNGPCNVIWDGYIHNYVQQPLWEQKFKTSVPDIIDGKDNKDSKSNTLPPPPPTIGLSDSEYQVAVDNENKNYKESQQNLQDRKDANQKSIDDLIKDPFKKQKDAKKARKAKREKRKKQTKEEQKKALKSRTNSVLQNSQASIVALLTLTLTNQLANIISQNDKIGKLVDDTNNIIIEANESGNPNKLDKAKTARDNAIKIIQNNEDKIRGIQGQIQSITTFASIFLIIVAVLSAIPIPVSFPPGLGIPMNIITLVSKLLEYANKLALALLALAPMLLAVLDKAISILEDYKAQLLDINGQLEKSAANGNNNLLYGSGGIQTGLTGETYKGFNFALKEESGPKALIVRGNKRHYAVAINNNNVEVLKSEYSFTLDPNDLISQLKLLIDQQNLSTGDGLSNNTNPNLVSNISAAKQLSMSIQNTVYPTTATTTKRIKQQ